MRLTVRVRGKPEAVLSVLKKMDNNSNCYVYVSVGSEEELLKLISLSVESGAFVEIIPGETTLLQDSSELTHQSKSVNQENGGVKSGDETSLLSKYKRRTETKVSPPQSVEQGRGESLKLQGEAREESRVRAESASQPPPPPPQSTPQPQLSSQHPVTPATQPPKQDRKASEGKPSKPEVEDVLAKAEEEASQTEEIQFEELVKMKEEAFSRKIIE